MAVSSGSEPNDERVAPQDSLESRLKDICGRGKQKPGHIIILKFWCILGRIVASDKYVVEHPSETMPCSCLKALVVMAPEKEGHC